MATALSPRLGDLPGAAKLPSSATLWKTVALALFAAWVLVIGAAHEPWVDEAQAWLLARDSGFVELLVERVRYEGTPGLWHAILWVAIRCDLPYGQLYLLSGGFAIAGAAALLWFSPFPTWMRLAIISSYFFAYQYAVVARSYAIDLLLIPLAAAWFGTRTERPVRYAATIGFLANLNAHSFVAAAALGAEMGWQLLRQGKLRRRESWVALLVAALLGVFALVCAWQPTDNGFLRAHDRSVAGVAVASLQQAFVDRGAIFSTSAVTPMDAIRGLGITVVVLAASMRLLLLGGAKLASFGALGAVLLFSSWTFASPWHGGLLYLFWIFALWVSWPTERALPGVETMIGFFVVAATQTVETVQSGLWDLSHSFSPGEEAARYLEHYQAERPGARVAAFGLKTFAMQPYWSGNRFSNYKNGASHPSWIDWRRGEPWDPFAVPADWGELLASRPDLIVASTAAAGRHTPPGTCEAGYVQRRLFRGALLWRGTVYEHDTIVFWERQGQAPRCA